MFMKKILLSLTLILVLVPNIYKAGITDAPNGNTNSKTTVENHYTDKNINIDLDLSNKKEYSFTESESNGKNLLMVLKYDKKASTETFYNAEGKEVSEDKAVFKINPTDNGYKAVAVNDDEVLTTNKKTKIYTNSVKTDSKTYFTGVTINGGGSGLVVVGDPDELVGSGSSITSGSATYEYRQDDYYTRTNYYLNLTYGQDTITYKILEGDNQKYEGKDLIIKISASFDKFESLKINDEVVDKENYDVVSGSTIVTLKNDYLKTLKSGEYNISVLFSDGSASTKFTINAKQEPKTSNKTSSNIFIYIGGTLSLLAIVIFVIASIKKKIKK